nr:hypothetical protein [Tanacetum cinerariifolium]
MAVGLRDHPSMLATQRYPQCGPYKPIIVFVQADAATNDSRAIPEHTTSGQFGNQRTVNVARARENVGSPIVQQFGIQCFNSKEFGHFAKECRKLKRVKDSAYHKEKMLMCKQAEQGVLLQAEQYD